MNKQISCGHTSPRDYGQTGIKLGTKHVIYQKLENFMKKHDIYVNWRETNFMKKKDIYVNLLESLTFGI